jgi:asparagine synthetase A
VGLEKVIRPEDRTAEYLKETVRRIVTAICMTGDELEWEFHSCAPI